jgi:peptidoglycan/LPS O-acetylase OafA/YrhL
MSAEEGVAGVQVLPRRRAARPPAEASSSLPAVRPSTGSRLPGIEGLRAVAACSVLVYHCWLFGSPDRAAPRLGPLTGVMPHLALGVVLFFALSGFLLYRPFAAAALRAVPAPSVTAYLRNRALRILPAYWAVLLVTGLILQAALLRDGAATLRVGSLARQPATLAKDLLLVQSYDPHTLLTGIGPAWSLVIEVAFYLALPLLATLATVLARRATSRAGRRRAVLTPPAAMLALGLSGKATVHFAGSATSFGWGADWSSVLARSFLANADLFAFGMALAVLHTELADDRLVLPRWWRRAALAVAAAAALVAVRVTPAGGGLGVPRYDSLMAVACGLLLAIAVVPDPDPARPRRLLWLLETRPLVAVGLASYSLFLWHEPLIHWLRGHGGTFAGSGGFLVNLVVVAAAAGGLAWLTYRYVELPALSRKRRQPSGDVGPHGRAPATSGPPRPPERTPG